MKHTIQEMKEERHKIAERLTKAMSEGRDMSIKEYANLNERYHWLNEKIIHKEKTDGGQTGNSR